MVRKELLKPLRGENLSTGYGRLQWLKYELEEHQGEIKFILMIITAFKEWITMTNDKKINEIIDMISEIILKYVEDYKESQCKGEEENLQVA